jgi:hypothetical protein
VFRVGRGGERDEIARWRTRKEIKGAENVVNEIRASCV